ncbi:MAG: hypothetical protein N838_06010 [Thiohalocapsa sp. PB-PSB1]|nr:MAG: hypothetical protein N838_06010 [Thiohalocapsa sp. PB-PSB1]
MDITLLERIVMHRVDMPLSIQIIPDQMLRQHDPSDDLERMHLANITHDLPQIIDSVHQQATRPFRQVDREERGRAFDQGPTLTHVLQCRFMFVVVG